MSAQKSPPSQAPQPTTKAVAPAARLAGLLSTEGVKKRFEEMLGKRAAQFTSSILSVVNSNKALAQCDPMSIISSAAIAASMDLPINQNLGFAWIVPYVNVAQFQMGWKGYVQLALRSGQYKTINAAIIYEGQLLEENEFTGEMKFQKERTSDKVVGYLLYFRLLNGFEKFCYLTKENAEKHGKKYSKSYAKGFGPWKDDFDSMALKTVVKNGLSKWGILSVEMQTAIVHDDGAVIDGEVVSYPDNEPSAATTNDAPAASSRLEKLIAGDIPEAEKLPFEKDLGTDADRAYATEKDK